MATRKTEFLFCLLILGCGILLSGCGGEPAAGTANPYYRQGVSLRQQNEMEKAAESFHKCLRVSPETADAHFQLGDLYENHLNSPVRAMHHYSLAIEGRLEEEENRSIAEESIIHLQQKLLEEWISEHPEIARSATDADELASQNRILTRRNQELKQERDTLVRARQTLLGQTRRLISEIRQKEQRINELEN